MSPRDRARAGLEGLRFFKMSGSGNDFVVFDGRGADSAALQDPGLVGELCSRRTGVGADGVVILASEPGVAFRMIYLNADGSRATMCGNAALCSTRLAVELGLGKPEGFEFLTDSGVIAARSVDGVPEIDLAPVTEVRPDEAAIPPEGAEQRIGYARVGVPHLVVRCPDVEPVDVDGRGGSLRRHPTLSDGANVDFVAPLGDGEWAMRTFERGVEAETLACGTGAVASALLLAAWGEAGEATLIRTRSGRAVGVRLQHRGGRWYPSLSGEGRIVFSGQLRELS